MSLSFIKGELSQHLPLYLLFGLFLITSHFLLHPRIVVPDSIGYYAYLRSMGIDGDLFFGDEFERWQVQPFMGHISRTGYFTNALAMGSSLLWAPFFLLAHLSSSLFSLGPADGYQPIYFLAVHMGSCVYGLFSLLLGYCMARGFFGFRASLLSVVCVWFGTPFLAYFFREGLYAHLPSAFGVSLFAFFWITYRPLQGEVKKWAALGFLGGFMALIRWQDGLFLLMPVLDCLFQRRPLREILKGIGITAPLVFLGFLPQILTLKALYGSLFTFPYGGGALHPLKPGLIKALFSANHGLFVPTPLYFVVILGFFFLFKRDRALCLAVGATLFLQVYATTIYSGLPGLSFGARRLISATALLALPLSAFIERTFMASRAKKALSFTLLALCMGWSLLFFLQFHVDLYNFHYPLSFKRLLEGQGLILKNLGSLLPWLGSSEEGLRSQGGLMLWPGLFIMSFVALRFLLWLKRGHKLLMAVVILSILGLGAASWALLMPPDFTSLLSKEQQEAVAKRDALLRLPPSEQQRMALAECVFRMGDFLWSAQILKELVGEGPWSEGAYLLLGQSLLRALEVDGAIKAFTRALDQNPSLMQEKEFLIDLATAHMVKGEMKEAMGFLQRAVADKDSGHAWALLGLCHFSLGNSDSMMRECFENALREDPSELVALEEMARLKRREALLRGGSYQPPGEG